MPKLTKRFVEGLRPTVKDLFSWDGQLPGFGVRVLPSGIRSYVLQYRNAHGRSRRFTIGRHGPVTADEARTRAHRILNAVRDGKDPVAERRAYLDAPTMNLLLDRYISEHVECRNRATTAAEVKRLVDRHLRPQLGAHKVAAVTRTDVAKLHRALTATPRQANFVLAVCSKAFSLAELWGMRPDGSNPCRRIERNAENHRERFLSADELGRLGTTLRQAEGAGLPWKLNSDKAAKHLPRPENRRVIYSRVTTAAIELLLFTGCRLSEILALRWDRVDFSAGTILLGETKAGRPQTVVMNAPARQVLTVLSKSAGDASPWVLPARDDLQTHLSKDAIERAWQKLRVVANLEDVHLHDLRHTVGTYAGQSGANAFLVRDLLRHANLAMTGRYVNRADDPVRALSDQVGERIAAGLAGCQTAEIVSIKALSKATAQ